MAGNKKPRKAYREKPVHVPMTAAKHATEATTLHAMVAGFCLDPTPALFNGLTRFLATLTDAISHLRGGKPLINDRDAAAIAMRSAILTLDAIAQRFDHTKGTLMVTAAEKMSLQRAALVLDGAIATIPANVLDAARLLIDVRTGAKT